MGIAPRTLPAALVLLLGVTVAGGAAEVEPDPHELYERAREHLTNGDLQAASASIARMRALIARGPDWDPDGIFARDLLPPLVARLRRLQTAARKLDAFSERALGELKPPEIAEDLATVRDYTEWATTAIEGLRAERDRIVTTLSDPDEQASLTRTTSYARTERLLETDVLHRLAESAGDDILGLLTGDPRFEAVILRFRQLKRDMMRLVVERDQAEHNLKKARERSESYLRALAVAVTGGDAAVPGDAGARPEDVAALFGGALDRDLEAVRSRSTQTFSERAARRRDLGRFRRCNQALVDARIGTDQSRRIEALETAVEETPLADGFLLPSNATGWLYGLLMGVLACGAGFTGWLAVTRGRRALSPADPHGPPGPGAVDRDRSARHGRHAA